MADPGDPTLFEEGPADEVIEAVAEAQRVLKQTAGLFDELDAKTLDRATWLEALAKLGVAQLDLQEPGKVIGRSLGVTSAKARMREYLLMHLNEPVENYALAGVAGTLEWARRVRELGLEEGWAIATGPNDELRTGQYRLDADEVDEERAETWRVRNEVRRRPGSGVSRCLAYLQAIHPNAATKEDLAYLSKINEWPRRMRELGEAGWRVVSSQDDPTLEPGSYRLDSLDQGPPRERRAIAQRHEILKRDNWTCQRCGASPTNTAGTRLQIHHRRHVAHGGGNDDDNLLTLCVPCHAGVHSLAVGGVADELLEPGQDPWIEGRPDDVADYAEVT